MMRGFILIAVALIATAVSIPACAPLDVREAGTKLERVTIGIGESGSNIELALGQRLVVRLPGNPTTGYRWSLVDSAGGVLKLDGLPTYVAGETATNVVGAGGTETWTFATEREGQQHLCFEYRRPWEEQASLPAKVASYTVTVR
jgi:inhibitor of cysteine peptidase